MQLSKRASEYLKKKKEDSGNITYIYSEKHIKERNKKKVKKILQLGKSLNKLRTQIKKDLNDDELKPVAMVIALIDETYERVGNVESAKTLKHFGITTLRKKHLSFSNGKAKLKYVGKSGVKQEKIIKNKQLAKDLKELSKSLSPNDELFPTVSAKRVNKYLKPFKITAKDIRGFHANQEMKRQLQKVKSKEKDPEKKRKEEFKLALEETAKIVGHNSSTLKNQYLAPSIEKNFLESGKFTIKAGLKLSIRSN